MKKSIFFLFVLSFNLTCFSQYWQQQTDIAIDVTLNDKEKTLDAFEKLVYTNNSPDTLNFIWFHLWPNAYKNDRTAFSDQLLQNGNANFYFSEKEERGYINHLDFKVNGITAATEDHPAFIDIIKLLLPYPLPPGGTVKITTPFHVKMPFNISRGGYDGESFQVTQWYPKPAVYDHNGWHPIPYLDQGEFYSEFGSFNIKITVPSDFIVAATGILQNPDDDMVLANTKENNVPTFKTLNYKQNNIHDFAWFANKEFTFDQDSCLLPGGKIITVKSYYTKKESSVWKSSLQMEKDALRFYSKEIGDYPYPVASIVQGPKSFGGGMEYPTIAIIAPLPNERELDETIAHELGHNWFYGAIASNERDHPWMDEGINTFYEYNYIESKYGPQTQEKELLFQTKALLKTDQPIETPSQNFGVTDYDLVAYHKTAGWLNYIETTIGADSFKLMMHEYYTQWAFKHPYPEDFKAILHTKTGSQTDSIFQLLYTKGILPGHHLKGFTLITAVNPNSVYNFLNHPTRNALLMTPAFGVNEYDKLMAGLFISNYKLPPTKFRFFAIPYYATGSKSFTGIGKLNYTIPPGNNRIKTELFLNGSTFSMDKLADTAGRNHYLHFKKLVPGLRFTLNSADPRSTITKYIQWKTFFISEQSFPFTLDTIVNGQDTAIMNNYKPITNKYYINQLQFVYENYRVLYPYKFTLQIEQAKDFIKPTFTMNYYFNYSASEGLSFRFFAGKFIYLGTKTMDKQFSNDRFFLNMTGPKGYEDYTYSDYFAGRNNYEGFTSQQIIIRDGAFKVRTDLLSQKYGKTDNWLTAVNLSTSLPHKINNLSILPFKIPIRIFMDAGTYAEAWQPGFNGDRILYDIGIHLPLFAETINVYVPLFYNNVYRDYFKQNFYKNRLLKTISFSIKFFNRDLKQINHEIEF